MDFCSAFDWDQTRIWTRNLEPQTQTTIPEMVSKRFDMTPNAVAIEAHDGTMTYRQLWRAAEDLTWYLINRGVIPSSCILLYFRKGLWACVSMLAVLEAGCCYTIVDAIHSVEHVLETVRTQRIQVALTDQSSSGKLAAKYPVVIPISQAFIESLPRESYMAPAYDPDELCFIIFTSGLSAERKGIEQQHASFCASLISFGWTLRIDPSTRILCHEDLSLPISNAAIWSALAFGATACIPSDDMLSEDFTEVVNRSRTTLLLTTSTSLARVDPEAVPSLRTVCVFERTLSQEVIFYWGSAQFRLGTLYALPECSVWVGFLEISYKTPMPTPIGRISAGAIYLTNPDNTNQMVPIGAIGRVVFEGPIAMGYLGKRIRPKNRPPTDFWNDPPKFLRHIHCEEKNRNETNQVFATGDLGRRNLDGTIEYIGRKSRMLRLGGNLIKIEDVKSLAVDEGDLVVLEVIEAEPPYFVVILQAGSGEMDDGDGKIVALHRCESMVILRKLEAIRERLEKVRSIQGDVKKYFAVREMPMTSSGEVDREFLREMAVKEEVKEEKRL